MKRKRDDMRELARRKLLPEPPPAVRSGTVCTIKFMLPGTGEVPPRRFAMNAAVDQLFCFLSANHNLMPSEIKLFYGYPKREVPFELYSYHLILRVTLRSTSTLVDTRILYFIPVIDTVYIYISLVRLMHNCTRILNQYTCSSFLFK